MAMNRTRPMQALTNVSLLVSLSLILLWAPAESLPNLLLRQGGLVRQLAQQLVERDQARVHQAFARTHLHLRGRGVGAVASAHRRRDRREVAECAVRVA